MADKSAKEVLSKISDDWFMKEPFLFNILCTHELKENRVLMKMFRTGRGNIEYNPKIMNKSDIKDVERNLQVEICRIALKHPYQRVPEFPQLAALTKSSDITLNEHCGFWELQCADYYNLENGKAYEEYYQKLKLICPDNSTIFDYAACEADNGEDSDGEEGEGSEERNESGSDRVKGNNDIGHEENGDSDGGNSENCDASEGKENSGTGKSRNNSCMREYVAAAQQSELWENCEQMQERINAEIEKAERSKQWGSLGGIMVDEILASVKIPMNYRRILSQFRAAIISQRRKLTRMKPNRRYGFDFMGSKFEPKTKLMVGIDVSGSISDEDIQHFLSIINQFFTYGVESVLVAGFDTDITQEEELKKAKKSLKITGRGGTCFQPIIDRYLQEDDYQGLIIFTDGYADVPVINKRKDILWILTSKDSYDDAINWIKKLKCRATWIPRV